MSTPAQSLVPETLGERLVLLRGRKKLSQADLARAVTDLGIPIEEPTISSYETGRRKPSFETLWAIAAVLDVKLTDLGATEEEYPGLRFARDPDMAKHIHRLLRKRREQRKLAAVPQ